MEYLISVAAGFVAGIAGVCLVEMIRKSRRRRKKREQNGEKEKFEFSKLILLAVLATYFWGLSVGTKIVFMDFTQLGVWLAYIGTPTTIAIGFYAWKAKAENIVKIKQANPTETEGVPIDLNNITP
ncbi:MULTISPECIES: hypothetical protein [Anaerotignum]|uniref:hypothetical protein n=1 Tax=Anaerotignum TaxID=2039240 RepID=UPI002108F0BB|nr:MULTISPECIES: hypothetical protein [Anaerotignum]MCQ4936727.1 hypothetical protein [Anaerotignum propionicum]